MQAFLLEGTGWTWTEPDPSSARYRQKTKKPTWEGWLFYLQIKDLAEPYVERAMGIEPTALAWEARVLPLYDARSESVILRGGPSESNRAGVVNFVP